MRGWHRRSTQTFHIPWSADQHSRSWLFAQAFDGLAGGDGRAFFDMVDGRGSATSQVTRFGGFFDSVIDRYSTWRCTRLLVYYASINRFSYIVLTAIVMLAA